MSFPCFDFDRVHADNRLKRFAIMIRRTMTVLLRLWIHPQFLTFNLGMNGINTN